eukprot:scaffold46943_cov23-Attheya_sp.AAC.1
MSENENEKCPRDKVGCDGMMIALTQQCSRLIKKKEGYDTGPTTDHHKKRGQHIIYAHSFASIYHPAGIKNITPKEVNNVAICA